MSILPGGENILVGGDDNVLAWYDLELSVRPYKALKFHKHAIQSARFHSSYPLFASASDDGTVQVRGSLFVFRADSEFLGVSRNGL